MESLNKPPRNPNGYIVFTVFIKNHLRTTYHHLSPQLRMKKAGEIWRSLSEDLRNEFKIYASNNRKLNSSNKPPLDEPGNPLKIIFDDHMEKFKTSNIPMSSDVEYNKLF